MITDNMLKAAAEATAIGLLHNVPEDNPYTAHGTACELEVPGEVFVGAIPTRGIMKLVLMFFFTPRKPCKIANEIAWEGAVPFPASSAGNVRGTARVIAKLSKPNVVMSVDCLEIDCAEDHKEEFLQYLHTKAVAYKMGLTYGAEDDEEA